MARNCLSLAKKFSIKCLALSRSLSKARGVVRVWRGGITRWDHRRLAGFSQRREHSLVGIERFVGNERLGLKLREQRIGPSQVMLLTTGEMKADRIAERIHQRVDLGGQPALAAADGLILANFLGAPAAC